MEDMKFIVIYDTQGTIISQYSSTSITPPVGVPYILIEDYTPSYDDDDYRHVERVDVSVEPHQLVFSLSRKEQEIANMPIEEYREIRQKENKEALAAFLKANPITWQDGLQYGVTQEDQNEMIADKAAYDLKHAIDPTWALQWHSIKTDCRDFTEEEFLGLMNTIISFVYPYRQLEMKYKEAIYSAQTKEEIMALQFEYKLPEPTTETTEDAADQIDSDTSEDPESDNTEE